MFVLGTTITSVPESLLKNIEAMAEQCAGAMGGDSTGNGLEGLDFGALMAGVQNMLKQK